MRTLLYQCPAGLSGDMNLAAMVALGVDREALEAELRKLPYEGWSLHFEDDVRSGITGLRCDVRLENTHSHSHDHDHSHDHGHHHHHHHRTFKEIREAIEASDLSDRVKLDTVACFRVLAEAEGAVHGIDPEEVHFHEVGAIDSIIDMVGAAVCWDLLNVDRVVCSTLEVGGGFVDCAHGRMPVPAPATARLLLGKPFTSGATDKETTTPTGAALLVGKGCDFGGGVSGTQVATATGIGQRDDPKLANAVQVSLFEDAAAGGLERDEVVELATNIDDMTGEEIAYLCEALRAAGALDVWQVPAYFKKGRAGIVVHVLVPLGGEAAVTETLFKQARTLGLRRQRWERSKLPRESFVVGSEWGEVRGKRATLPDGSTFEKFEYDDLARIARETGKPMHEIEAVLRALLDS